MSGRDPGYVLVGGHRFGVTAVRLAHGQVEVDIELPRSGTVAGNIRLFGQDGRLVCVGKRLVIPAHKSWVLFTYQLTVSVLTADELQDMSELPGWH